MKRTEKLLCAASVPALAALGGLYGLYRYAFRSPNRVQNDDYHITVNPQMNVFRAEITECITRLNALPYERVYITSADGLRLAARYYPAKPGAPLVIACHGYRGTPSRDFSAGADIYRDMGCALLLIEERAQCGSEGRTITFGAMEKLTSSYGRAGRLAGSPVSRYCSAAFPWARRRCSWRRRSTCRMLCAALLPIARIPRRKTFSAPSAGKCIRLWRQPSRWRA